MPYEGEYAAYRPLDRIAKSDQVRNLLGRSRVLEAGAVQAGIQPSAAPSAPTQIADFVLAIDGSLAEIDAKNGYPGAKIGYVTVASVLLLLSELERIDVERPINPERFRTLEECSTMDAALPGSNIVTRDHRSAASAFREELYELFNRAIFDEAERVNLLDTYQALLALKPKNVRTGGQKCPYSDCEEHLSPQSGLGVCACARKRPIYSTDALRIHERFHDVGSNGEAFGEVMQVCERVLLVHLLRAFERRGMLGQLSKLAFFLDGPLAVYGHPAWLSAAIQKELVRINTLCHQVTGSDLLILGIEKTGAFVEHFDHLDALDSSGNRMFQPRQYAMLTDEYIKSRVIFSDSDRRYGQDTYFGRKFFYKSSGGAKIVANIPFLTTGQDTLDTADVSLYPQFAHYCALIDKLVSSRYPNALMPIVSAHAQAAIPLSLGSRVLEQLAKALVKR